MKPTGITKSGKLIFSEYQEHIKLVQYLNVKKILFHHAPMEGIVKTESQKINKMRRGLIGAKAGYPDFIIFLDDFLLFIELKRVDAFPSNLSKEQIEWIVKLNKIPYTLACWCKGSEQAIETIETYSVPKLKYNPDLGKPFQLK